MDDRHPNTATFELPAARQDFQTESYCASSTPLDSIDLPTKARDMRRFCSALLTAVPLWLVIATCPCSMQPVHAEIRPDFLMLHDPEVSVPAPVKMYSPKLKALWLAALDRPEHAMQRQAAETIAKAHLIGVPELHEAIPKLEKLLVSEDSHPATRFAAARALIVLQAKETASRLLDVAQRYQVELRQLIEPVLAEWDYAPARDVWLGRLSQPQARERDIMLALRCLASVNELRSGDGAKRICLDSTRRPDLRLEAATTAGLMTERDLESDARRLMASTHNVRVERICAVRLLARQASPEAQSLLLELARDDEPSVAAAALVRLNQIDPSLVLPLADAAMNHSDPHVRRQGAESYIQRPTPERIVALSRLLDDVHPQVRADLREALFQLASIAGLSDPIRNGAMEVLSRDSWRGQEQAALLLAALDHKPAADQLVVLLDSPRKEVLVTAAWGLRRLAVPATFPAMLDKARRQTDARKTAIPPGLDDQVAHLFEAFGQAKYAPAEPLMREYIPLNMLMGVASRSAAIWSLGWLHVGKSEGDLPKLFIERVLDPATMPPELDEVREFSTVSLARMKAVAHVDELRGYSKHRTSNERSGLIARWALNQLTGETIPNDPPNIISPGVWFLEPYGAE
jgi:HEAT repeat protein